MPPLEKPPATLVARFEAVAARHPEARRRPMFGNPALFIGNHMATGLFADRWVVRLAPIDLDALLAMPGAEPFSPAPGRSMTGWALLPRDVVADDNALDEWLDRAFARAASMPSRA